MASLLLKWVVIVSLVVVWREVVSCSDMLQMETRGPSFQTTACKMAAGSDDVAAVVVSLVT